MLLLRFQNVIVILTTLIRWLIPDVPRSIQAKIREDNRLTNELIILQELKRRQLERGTRRSVSCRDLPDLAENPAPDREGSIVAEEDSKPSPV